MEWHSQPKQYDFLTSKEFCVLYGGARGGGKTDGMLMDLITTCMEYPGAQCAMIRREFAELNKRGAAIPRSHELLHNIASWRGAPSYTWTFPNGSVIEFGHLSDARAINKYLGAQYHKIAIDQAEEILYEEFNKLKGSLRGSAIFNVDTGEMFVPNMRLGANPGGIGQSWIKSLFIDAAPVDTTYWVDTREDDPVVYHHPMPFSQTYRFIPAKVWDNQELLKANPEYINNLYSVGGVLARAWINGDWGGFAGQFFEEFSPKRHVVKPFRIPTDWPKWHSTDYGISKPSCTLWLARAKYASQTASGLVIPRSTIVVYRERYDIRKTVAQQALTIKTWSGNEQFRNQLLDPACWGTESNGLTIAEQFARNGVSMAKAFNKRPEGWARMRELLMWCNNPELHPCERCRDHTVEFVENKTHQMTCSICQQADARDGCEHNTFMPQLLIQSHCVNLIRTLPNLVHDPKNPEDVDTTVEDHAPDALRYGIMGADVQSDEKPIEHGTAYFGARR